MTLPNGIAARVQAGAQRVPVRLDLLLRSARTVGQARVVVAFTNRPVVTLVAVLRLLLRALPVVRRHRHLNRRGSIDGGSGWWRWRRYNVARRRLHNRRRRGWIDDNVPLRALHVVHAVRVVIGHASGPHGRVVGRQHRNDNADRWCNDNEASGRWRAVPDAASEEEGNTLMAHCDVPGWQRAKAKPHRRVVAIVVITRVEVRTLVELVLAEFVFVPPLLG